MLTRMSIAPNALSVVCSTSFLRSRAELTSPRTASAPRRSASRSSTSRRRANIATFAPSSDSAPRSRAPSRRRRRRRSRLRPFNRALRLHQAQHADDFAHRVGGLLQPRLLLLGEVELDDLLDTARAQLHGDAHVEAVDPVLAFEQRRAREDALSRRASRRRPSAPPPRRAAYQADVRAARRPRRRPCGCVRSSARSRLRRRASSGGRRRGRRADDGNHLVAVPAEHDGRDVLHRRARLQAMNVAKRRCRGCRPGRRRVAWGKADVVVRDVAHRVERVRDDDEHCVGALGDHRSVTEPTIFSFVVTRSSRLIPGERGRPAVMTTTSEPAVSAYPFDTVTRGS